MRVREKISRRVPIKKLLPIFGRVHNRGIKSKTFFHDPFLWFAYCVKRGDREVSRSPDRQIEWNGKTRQDKMFKSMHGPYYSCRQTDRQMLAWETASSVLPPSPTAEEEEYIYKE